MLILDLQRLRDAPVDVAADVPGDDPLWDDTGIRLAAPMTVRARAEGTGGDNVWVRGFLETRVASTCRRCLTNMEVAVREEFQMLFDPTITEADEDFTLYRLSADAEELDLGPSIRERLLLKMPKFPVCRAECRGLCAYCGADLNAQDCGCTPMETDPRWGPLLALRGEG